MRAGERACACPECGVICQGQFDGCPDVWSRGPRPVALTVSPAVEAPRVRALAAGLGGPEPAFTASPAPAATTNGNGSGYASAPPPPPPPPPPPTPRSSGDGQGAGSRTEVLRWFEDAFDELRNELHAMASTVARQQAMLAELVDAREAELRVVMVAESLPELAGEAAAKALADQSDSLADVVADALDDLRATMRAADLSSTAVMDGMRELLRRVELTAEANTDDARLEGAAHLQALKASVGRQLRPVTAAVTEIAAHIAAAEELHVARDRALKASITRQVRPLAAAVEAAVEHSDRQFGEVLARLDALTATSAATAATPKAKPKSKAKAAPAPAAAKAPRTRAKAASPCTRTQARPRVRGRAPAPAPLLNRRRPAARTRGSGPRAGA